MTEGVFEHIEEYALHKEQEGVAHEKLPYQELNELEPRKRAEVLLQRGRLLGSTIEILGNNPLIEKTVFISQVTEMAEGVDYAEATAFARDLEERKAKVLLALEKGRRLATSQGIDLAQEMYRATITDEERASVSGTGSYTYPKHPVTIDENYPLAVALTVGKEDFEMVDPRTNIGGFFWDNRIPAGSHEDPKWTPIIMVRARAKDKVMGHEQGHAEQTAFEKLSISKDTPEVVTQWGYWENDAWVQDELKSVQRAYAQGIPLERLRGDPRYESVLAFAFFHAKKEFLAEMKPKEGHPRAHLAHLQESGGVYDYFHELLDVPVDTEFHEALWKDYSTRLGVHAKSALYCMRAYSREAWPKEKRDDFRWVLAQIPLELWNNQLQEMPFEEECRQYTKFFHDLNSVTFYLEAPTSSFAITDEEQGLMDEAVSLREAMNTCLSIAGGDIIVDEITAHAGKLAEICVKARNTELSRINFARSGISYMLETSIEDISYLAGREENPISGDVADDLKERSAANLARMSGLLAERKDTTCVAMETLAQEVETLSQEVGDLRLINV